MESITIKTEIPEGYEKACVVMLSSLCVNYCGTIKAIVVSENFDTLEKLICDMESGNRISLVKFDSTREAFDESEGIYISVLTIIDVSLSGICNMKADVNSVLEDRIKYLDELRSRCISYEALKGKAIIVFNDVIPWDGSGLHSDIEQIWWEYAKLTPFYREFQELFLECSLADEDLEKSAIRLCDEIDQIDDALKKANQIIKSMQM